MKERNLIPVIIATVGFIIGVFLFSGAFKESRQQPKQITVTGSAKIAITSDLAILAGTINSYAPSQSAAYRYLESQKPTLINYLVAQGFDKSKIEFQTVYVMPNYELNQSGYSTGVVRGYTYSQRFTLESSDVMKIRDVSLSLPNLVEQGMSLQMEPPQYLYVKLADLKIQVQAEAAKDAMMRAKKIAEATGSKLGPIRDARMGVLQITPKNSTEISDYGMNDVGSIEKEITAVINASFGLE
jgi:hypothetical protein